MTLIRLVQVVSLAYGLYWLVRLAAAGWRRRKPYWSAGSWWRFAAICALCLCVASLPMFPAVERLVTAYPRYSQARTLGALALVACLAIGAGGLAILIGWFGTGEPDRQFPRLGSRTAVNSRGDN